MKIIVFILLLLAFSIGWAGVLSFVMPGPPLSVIRLFAWWLGGFFICGPLIDFAMWKFFR